MDKKNATLSIHPLQSKEWGEFRKKTGIKVIQKGNFQMTIHKIPYLPWAIGYLPKGPLPTAETIRKLKAIGKQEKCIFIQLEPNVKQMENGKWKMENLGLISSFHPLFTKYAFILDLTKSEDELLKAMHPKTRYNIKVAQKHGVYITEDNSDKAFKTYLKLTKETTKRQNFYAHTEDYHRLMWETIGSQKSEVRGQQVDTNKLTAHLFLAKFRPPNSPPAKAWHWRAGEIRPLNLVTWILFVFKDTLYYPYGASSDLYRETMASNLMLWEAIRYGKKLGLKNFDLWGALGPNPDKNDTWYGFHRFKQGYGGKLVEFIGSFDLVINPALYVLYEIADKIRWLILKIKK